MGNMQTTNAGLNLLRDATIGASGANPQAQYLALGTGAGTLSGALTSGTVYTSLAVAALPAAIAAGQSLTIINGANTQVVTVAAGGAGVGATSVPVNSFTANFSYPSGSGIVNTPSLADTQLQVETFRNPVSSSNPGASAGEALVTLYVAPTDVGSSQLFLEAGIYAGTPTGAANSGTLLARAVIWFNYTMNVTSGQLQFDYTLASA